MNVILNNKGNVYEQIVNHFVKYIELGIYQHEEKLPSCRELASSLGVNPNTVAKAYTKLEDDGYIMCIPKKGNYVIYDSNNTEKKSKLLTQLNEIKNEGVTFEELVEAIREVYEK